MCGGVAAIDAVDNCLGGNEIGRFSRTVGGTAAPARSARSIPHGRARPTCRTASWTRATPRCRLHGSTSTSPAPSARWPRLTSTSSTAATGPALARRLARTTRTTCTPRSTCRCFRATSLRRASCRLHDVGRHGSDREQLPGLPVSGSRSSSDARTYHFWDLLNTHSRGGLNACRDDARCIHPAADWCRLRNGVHG